MGTAISVDVRDEGVGQRQLDDVFAWFRRVDDVFSTYRENSQLCRLGRGEITVADCCPDVAQVLARCELVRQDSDGYFDVWATGTLDPSGLVKGWSVELASAMLLRLGSLNHCINAGGDVRMRGEPEPGRPWHIGIAHPLEPGALTVVVTGQDLAVATSGTAERGLHIVNPVTGRPADALASVTVVGPELALADAYATAAVAMGFDAPSWLAGLAAHEAYVIDAGGHVWWSDGFARYAPALGTMAAPRLVQLRRTGPHPVGRA